jgi:uncharacterized membrane protein (UPF0136 family)
VLTAESSRYSPRLLFGRVVAEVVDLASDLATRGPASGLLVAMNASKARPALGSLVLKLLGSRGDDPEVASAVVELVAVDVIDLARVAGVETHQHAVHEVALLADALRGVTLRVEVPVLGGEHGVVLGINADEGADAAVPSVEWDERDIEKIVHGAGIVACAADSRHFRS